jgi:hypothetical protein
MARSNGLVGWDVDVIRIVGRGRRVFFLLEQIW